MKRYWKYVVLLLCLPLIFAACSGAEEVASVQEADLFVHCCDGRTNLLPPASAAGPRPARLQLEYQSVGGSVPDNLANDIAYIEETYGVKVTRIYVSPHTVLPQCVGCGGQGIVAQLEANQFPRGVSPEFVDWAIYNIASSDPMLQAQAQTELAMELTSGQVEIVGMVFDHVQQTYYPVSYAQPGFGIKNLTAEQWQTALSSGDFAPTHNALGLTEGVREFLRLNEFNAGAAAYQAGVLNFAEGQSFQRLLVNGTPFHPSKWFPQLAEPDSFFGVTALPGMGENHHASQQMTYGWQHGQTSEFLMIMPSVAAAKDYLVAANQYPELMALINSGWQGRVRVAIVQGDSIVQEFLLRHPGQAVQRLSLDVTAGGTAVAGALPYSFRQTNATRVLTLEEISVFETAIADLRATSPETVAAARNTLAEMGAIRIDGTWVFRSLSNGAIASGPINLARLATRYPDGQLAFIGWQTRGQVFGLERALNVTGGIAGWRLYSPGLSLNGVTIAGLPASQVLAKSLGVALTAGWVGLELNEVAQFTNQTEFLVRFPDDQVSLYNAPAGASTLLWEPPDKTPFVNTSWVFSQEWLQQGWNGSGFGDPNGTIVPAGQKSSILLIGGLAGQTLYRHDFNLFGLEGNRVAGEAWEYQRNADGTFTLWLNGEALSTGTSGYYVETHWSDSGLWTIPMFYEHGTPTCPGLCITQAQGGEEFLFATDAEPRAVELCPDPTLAACAPAMP